MQAGQFRVSLKSDLNAPNHIFNELNHEIYATLINNTEQINNIQSLYTARRLSNYSADERRAMLSRCPEDIREAATGETPAIDALELDLIDFLLHFKENRLLSVIGTVGIGKTTFLNYIFDSIRSRCVSLQHFTPLILNCLAIGDRDLSYTDLMFESVRALRKGLGASVSPELEAVLGDYPMVAVDLIGANAAPREYKASHVIDLIQRAGRALGQTRELVIVFDNVDQLTTAAVERVASLATSLHLATRLAVISAMRPATFRTQAERAHGVGAIYSFRLDIAPPDLRSVVASRMRKALIAHGPLNISPIGKPRLEISDANASVQSLCRRVLTRTAQQFLLRDLCNNNVRKALAAFAFFLRYRELRPELFNPLSQVQIDHLRDRSQEQSWRNHLLDGLMIGDNEYFVDKDNNSPITNVFYFEHNGIVYYCLIYRLLCVLEWSSRFVEVKEFLSWLRSFGYKADLVRSALTKLMIRGLVYSPESETDIASARNIKISPSGQMYLSFLMNDPQYLLNAVCDIPLPHAAWAVDNQMQFTSRLASVSELMDAVFQQESSELAHLISDRESTSALGSVVYCGILSKRILKTARRLVSDGRFSSHHVAREASGYYDQVFRAFEAKLPDGEKLLTDELVKRRVFVEPEGNVVIDVRLGYGSELRISSPSVVSPASPNSINVSLRVNEPSLPEVPKVLTMLWQAIGRRASDLARLEQAGEDDWHHGKLIISDVSEVSYMPRAQLTFFADANPILIRTVDFRRG